MNPIPTAHMVDLFFSFSNFLLTIFNFTKQLHHISTRQGNGGYLFIILVNFFLFLKHISVSLPLPFRPTPPPQIPPTFLFGRLLIFFLCSILFVYVYHLLFNLLSIILIHSIISVKLLFTLFLNIFILVFICQSMLGIFFVS